MNFFAENLLFLKSELNITQASIASGVKVRTTTVANWISKESEPDVSKLLEVAQFFGVSLEALVMTHLENGNLIDEIRQNFLTGKGKVIGKPSGKVIPVKTEVQAHSAPSQKDGTEPILSVLGSILEAVREINGKLGQERVSKE